MLTLFLAASVIFGMFSLKKKKKGKKPKQTKTFCQTPNLF